MGALLPSKLRFKDFIKAALQGVLYGFGESVMGDFRWGQGGKGFFKDV